MRSWRLQRGSSACAQEAGAPAQGATPSLGKALPTPTRLVSELEIVGIAGAPGARLVHPPVLPFYRWEKRGSEEGNNLLAEVTQADSGSSGARKQACDSQHGAAALGGAVLGITARSLDLSAHVQLLHKELSPPAVWGPQGCSGSCIQ